VLAQEVRPAAQGQGAIGGGGGERPPGGLTREGVERNPDATR
jgi:hypothetical protein